MSLCEPCRSAFHDRVLVAGAFHDHHPSWASFAAAADGKCPICWRRFDALSATQQDLLKSQIENLDALKERATLAGAAMGSDDYVYLEFHTRLSFTAASLYANGTIDRSTQRGLDRVHEVLMYSMAKLAFLPLNAADQLVSRITDPNTGSDSSWKSILSWINECKSNHSACSGRRSLSNWYPTRLLDLGPHGSCLEGTDTFKIIGREEVVMGAPYITLSHRWGTDHTPRLTVADMPRYSVGVRISELPRTYQDAILVTRRLSIRYIWIDSLCIIQEGDEGRDWNREAPEMAKVYSNGFLNISADWGTGDDGLFFDRDIELAEKLQLGLKIAVDTRKRTRNGTQSRKNKATAVQYIHVPISDLERVDTSPLANRGWVFQERILSPVVLHFDRKAIIWECCQTLASESLPRGLPSIHPTEMDRLSQKVAIKRLDPAIGQFWLEKVRSFSSRALDDHTELASHLMWEYLVTSYSQCDLSFETDRLVAIAGVAQYMKPLFNDQYVAGLWRKHLAAQMLWMSKSPRSRWRRDSHRMMLSFSWTSANGPVRAASKTDLEPTVKVAPVHWPVDLLEDGNLVQVDEIVREDIYGPLRQPVLQLRVVGTVKTMKLRRHDRLWHIIPVDQTHELSGAVPKVVPESNHTVAHLDFVVDESEEAAFEATIFYYMLWDFTGHCLLLELSNWKNGQFWRLGTSFPSLVAPQERLQALAQEQESEALLPGYDKDTKKHTIYII